MAFISYSSPTFEAVRPIPHNGLWCSIKPIAQGNPHFQQTDKVFITNLANTCPLVGGRSVYTARALRAYFEPNIHYDDRGICHQVGLNFRVVKPKKEQVVEQQSVKLYPNPTANNVNIAIEGYTGSIKVDIIDVLGRNIATNTINTGLNAIDVSTLTNGTYILRFWSDQTIISTQKLIIAK